ncbi:MAG TPA: ACP S-malonyltransferase [Gemmatimonadaceae bacterium]|nr:ACP S-malonyltransferase [Gemmatimonadaceae bacterium]
MDVVLLFPGQGSQKPGMGKDLAAAFPAAREVFDRVDEALGASLSTLCFEGPADALTLTHNAQPALLAHGAAVWAVVRDQIGSRVRAGAGHSLGEFTAHVAAGTFGVAAGARLVRRRGELMYETGVARPGAMAAILGETSEPIESICRRASAEAGLVVPANYNAPDQLVISGEVNGVERAMVMAKEAGAKRAVRLNVSGAFHSPLMEPALDGLRAALSVAGPSDGAFPVYANVDASPVRAAADASDRLARQLTSPVRWVDEVRRLVADQPGALFVELGPGNVLAGLMKRIAPDAAALSCAAAGDVDKLLGRLAQPA